MASSDAPRRATRIPAGTTVALNNLNGEPMRRVLFGATWDDPNFDVDMCAVLLGDDGKVADRTHFLYRRNRQSPEHAGFIGYVPPGASGGPDRAQVILDLERMPASVQRIALAFSAVQPRAVLSQTGVIKARAMDLDNGQTSLVYLHDASSLSAATCLSLWALQRSGAQWNVVVHGTPYPGGPPAFARDHGVTFG